MEPAFSPGPKAILCVSAHWLTLGSWVTAMTKPRTIHDFGGFPQRLFEQQYPAPGAPDFAELTQSLVNKTEVGLDHEWGFDHGTWSVLAQMFPEADIPTFQFSIDYHQPPAYHYALAAELRALRKKGVLIMGSGNIVHNLRRMQFTTDVFDWTVEFDEKIADFLTDGNDQGVINYKDLGSIADLAVPTPDHYYPLIYVLGVKEKGEEARFFNASNTMGSISMRSVMYG